MDYSNVTDTKSLLARPNLPILAIVVPCYNEESVLPETCKQLSSKLQTLIASNKITQNSFILLVDDGSHDKTWPIITALQQQNIYIKGIKLSRNFGHQAALLCGLLSVNKLVDCTLSIDADLQDEITSIDEFIAQFQTGYDIVYGVRRKRANDSWLKKYSALAFYKLMRLFGTQIVVNHADYRLLSQRVLNYLADFNETTLFLRGLIPLIGFKSTYVYYERQPRFAGKTKYSLSRMFNFALNGITALTIAPLRLISLIGSLSLVVSLILITYFIGYGIFNYHHVPHWLFILVPICFIGSIQLISLGIIGEYLGRIYNETKARPNYIIASKNL